jgi:hypothetical protein
MAGVDFRKIGVGRSLSDVVMSWLRLQTHLECITTSMSYVYTVFQHLDMPWMGIWVRHYTVMLVQVRVDFKENWGGVEPERCCNVIVKAPNPHRLHPTSKSYVYKVFQHLAKLWMGIRVRPYTVMPVEVGSGV